MAGEAEAKGTWRRCAAKVPGTARMTAVMWRTALPRSCRWNMAGLPCSPSCGPRTMDKPETVGRALAKTVLQDPGADETGKTLIRRQLRRGGVRGVFGKRAPCHVGMAACAIADHRARELLSPGTMSGGCPRPIRPQSNAARRTRPAQKRSAGPCPAVDAFRHREGGGSAGGADAAQGPGSAGPAADDAGRGPARPSRRARHHFRQSAGRRRPRDCRPDDRK